MKIHGDSSGFVKLVVGMLALFRWSKLTLFDMFGRLTGIFRINWDVLGSTKDHFRKTFDHFVNSFATCLERTGIYLDRLGSI